MEEHAIYFATKDFYDIIRKNGGSWNDTKERPLVCLIRSVERLLLVDAFNLLGDKMLTKEELLSLH